MGDISLEPSRAFGRGNFGPCAGAMSGVTFSVTVVEGTEIRVRALTLLVDAGTGMRVRGFFSEQEWPVSHGCEHGCRYTCVFTKPEAKGLRGEPGRTHALSNLLLMNRVKEEENTSLPTRNTWL